MAQHLPGQTVGYLPTFDGWRAVAILMVIFHHDKLHRLGLFFVGHFERGLRPLPWLQTFPLNWICLFGVTVTSYYGLEKPMLRMGRRLATKYIINPEKQGTTSVATLLTKQEKDSLTTQSPKSVTAAPEPEHCCSAIQPSGPDVVVLSD